MSLSLFDARTALMMLVVGGTAALVGCERGEVSEVVEGPSTEELVQFYSPKSIKILPFTKARSFDDDAIPDGIGVSLRTLDAAGDSVKAYGTFIFELYAYRPASLSHRGAQLQTWTQLVVSPDDQKQFWERVTTMYEFQLSWEGEPLVQGNRYILAASFQAPGAKRLFDEYEFEFKVRPQDIINAVTESQS